MTRYEGLKAWQAAHELALRIYRMTGRWPSNERFGLTSNSAGLRSRPRPNAEGAAKRGAREFRRFLDTALGSLSEVYYPLKFSRDYGVLTGEDWVAMEALRSQAGRLTWRLYTVVAQQAKDQSST